MVKETIEEAATEAAEDCYECRYDDRHTGMRIAKEAFIYGAEWQRKQSPWISVEDRLPDVNNVGESEFVLVKCEEDSIPEVAQYCTLENHNYVYFKWMGKKYISNWITPDCRWIKCLVKYWMPIPRLDYIKEK